MTTNAGDEAPLTISHAATTTHVCPGDKSYTKETSREVKCLDRLSSGERKTHKMKFEFFKRNLREKQKLNEKTYFDLSKCLDSLEPVVLGAVGLCSEINSSEKVTFSESIYCTKDTFGCLLSAFDIETIFNPSRTSVLLAD